MNRLIDTLGALADTLEAHYTRKAMKWVLRQADMRGTIKSCENCIYSHTENYPGTYFDPPEYHFECTHGSYNDKTDLFLRFWYEMFYDSDFVFQYLDQAHFCPGYTPYMASECRQCGKRIDVEEIKWRIWATHQTFYWEDPVPMCSDACRDAYEEATKDMEDDVPF